MVVDREIEVKSDDEVVRGEKLSIGVDLDIRNMIVNVRDQEVQDVAFIVDRVMNQLIETDLENKITKGG